MGLDSSNPQKVEYLRGDIWWVNFEPTIGSEIQKQRPAVIISVDGINTLDIRLVVPLRDWKTSHNNMYWCVPIEPSVKNGLTKKSTADLLQTRCVDTSRFVNKIGVISAEDIEDIVSALAAVTNFA